MDMGINCVSNSKCHMWAERVNTIPHETKPDWEIYQSNQLSCVISINHQWWRDLWDKRATINLSIMFSINSILYFLIFINYIFSNSIISFIIIFGYKIHELEIIGVGKEPSRLAEHHEWAEQIKGLAWLVTSHPQEPGQERAKGFVLSARLVGSWIL